MLRAAALCLALAACAPTTDGGIHARMAFSESEGLRIVDVPDGPSRRAGLRVGDRIVTIDGAPVRTLLMREIVERLRGEAGTDVDVEVVRDGDIHAFRVRRVPYR